MDIDVDDLLVDITVAADTFDVIRRAEVVGANGLPTLTPTTTAGVRGAVYPAGDNSLVRDEAYSTQNEAIEVVTQYRLRGASKDIGGVKYQPDLILWAGAYYIVKDVNDYTRYGRGFVKADCIGYDYVAQAPR